MTSRITLELTFNKVIVAEVLRYCVEKSRELRRPIMYRIQRDTVI